MIKRLFDCVFSLVGILLLSLLLLYIAIRIWCNDHGPVFYRGERVGRNCEPFKIYKFRSMVMNADKIGPSSTSDEDPRITKIGHTLRRYKLDELPQLFNVLRGEMSFVGPRPQVVSYLTEHPYTIEEMRVFNVRPGITDWASIKFHNEGEIIEASGMEDADEAYSLLIHPEKIKLQLRYVEHNNLWIDIKIIFQTLTKIVSLKSTFSNDEHTLPIEKTNEIAKSIGYQKK